MANFVRILIVIAMLPCLAACTAKNDGIDPQVRTYFEQTDGKTSADWGSTRRG